MSDTPIKAGTKLFSTVCDTQVMVLRLPAGTTVSFTCGGAPMTTAADCARTGEPTVEGEATLAGKRYVDADETLELLCVKGGAGGLAANGAPLGVKTAKQLPSSD